MHEYAENVVSGRFWSIGCVHERQVVGNRIVVVIDRTWPIRVHRQQVEFCPIADVACQVESRLLRMRNAFAFKLTIYVKFFCGAPPYR